jgi:bifunctional non-homologous end joining protein LigD
MIFDLDPGTGVPWRSVVLAARRVRAILESLGLASFVKTTGGKGLHVVVPLAGRNGWDAVKSFARAVAEQMAREEPDQYVATMAKQARVGKIYVDYLRNTRGATAIAAYSARARPGAPFSTPVSWRELGGDLREKFGMQDLKKRLRFRGDAWDGFRDARPILSHAMMRAVGAT